jgi:hypothetical protein
VQAGIIDQQEPSPAVLKKLNISVGKLPQKVVKVMHSPGRINLLRKIAATD